MKGGAIIYWLSRFLPDDWKGILGVLVGVVLLIICCAQFVNRKNGSAVLYLLFGGLFVWLGMGMYNDNKPYAKEQKPIFNADFDKEEQARLETLHEQVGKLRQQIDKLRSEIPATQPA